MTKDLAHLLKELSTFYLSLQNHSISRRTSKVANSQQDSMPTTIPWPQGKASPGRSWHPNASGCEHFLPGLQRLVRRVRRAVWMALSPPLPGRDSPSVSFWKGPAGLCGSEHQTCCLTLSPRGQQLRAHFPSHQPARRLADGPNTHVVDEEMNIKHNCQAADREKNMRSSMKIMPFCVRLSLQMYFLKY